MSPASSRSTHKVGDLLFDTIFIAGIGGGLIALFFMVFDLATRGQALFTPSLMGSVLFEGASAGSVQSVSMLAVAKFTAVHVLAFTVFGLGLAFVVQQVELHLRHPVRVIAMVFVALEVGFWVATTVAIPGVVERIGIVPIAAANLIAAVGIGLFLASTHRTQFWSKVARSGIAPRRG
jgi:hypothetical protein